MELILAHASNPDIAGGYWQPSVDPKRTVVEVPSLAAARSAFIAWRDRNGLGSGNIARDGGLVSEGKKPLARISYNGKVWTPEAFSFGTEIVLDQATQS